MSCVAVVISAVVAACGGGTVVGVTENAAFERTGGENVPVARRLSVWRSENGEQKPVRGHEFDGARTVGRSLTSSEVGQLSSARELAARGSQIRAFYSVAQSLRSTDRRSNVRLRGSHGQSIARHEGSGTEVFLTDLTVSKQQRVSRYVIERNGRTVALRTSYESRVGDSWILTTDVVELVPADGGPVTTLVSERLTNASSALGQARERVQLMLAGAARLAVDALLPAKLEAMSAASLLACEAEDAAYDDAWWAWLQAATVYSIAEANCSTNQSACASLPSLAAELETARATMMNAAAAYEACMNRITNVPGGGYMNSEGKWCTTWLIQQTTDGGVTWVTIDEFTTCEREYET